MSQPEYEDGAVYWVRFDDERFYGERWVAALYQATGDHGHPGWLVPGCEFHVDLNEVGPCLGKEPCPPSPIIDRALGVTMGWAAAVGATDPVAIAVFARNTLDLEIARAKIGFKPPTIKVFGPDGVEIDDPVPGSPPSHPPWTIY